MNLLVTLPDWFTSWGWIACVAAGAVIIAAIVLLCVLLRAKNKKASAQPEEASPIAEAEPAEETQNDCAAPSEAVAGQEDNAVEATEREECAPGEEQNQASAEQAKPKPANKTYHIGKRKTDGKWQVKMAGGAKAIKLFSTQLEAIAYAKKLAENQEAKIVIHKEDGTFRRLTYHKKKQ